MKQIIRGMLVTMGCALAFCSWGDSTNVNGYFKKDGTYVPPHVRTTPNDSKLDNWSTRGNVNPHTGKNGTKDPYKYHRPK
ncbi:MAG: hypothetical protein ABW171_02410 [Steroidobacter sp.]